MPPRLVVVSNRVPVPAAPGEAGTSVGGLVAAVEPAVLEVGGLWLGRDTPIDDG